MWADRNRCLPSSRTGMIADGRLRWLRPGPSWVVWTCLAPLVAVSVGLRAAVSEREAGGFGMHTVGGLEGRLIRVTSLAQEGPGTLRAAIEAWGPRFVVFEVGGVIDLARKRLRVREPYLTIAGQTAPGPILFGTGFAVEWSWWKADRGYR